MKVKLSCPLCGQQEDLAEMEAHIENEHGMTGEMTLILNPTKPYSYVEAKLTAIEPEAPAEEPAAEVSETVEPEPEAVPGEEPAP